MRGHLTMPRISHTAPLLRPCLNHPRAHSICPQPSRCFAVSTRSIGAPNSLLFVDNHLRRSGHSPPRLLPCIAHREYRNKHLPKKRGLLRLKNDHQRNVAMDRMGEKMAKFNALLQQGILKETEQEKRNLTADALDQVKSSAMDDLGYIPGTVVVITRSWWPSFWHEPKKRMRMEYVLIKSRLRDMVGILVASFSLGFRNLFNRRFSRADARQAAVALHHQMYKTLAEGETRDLESLALAGLRKQMHTQIAQRPPGKTYSWERRNVHAKLLSHRISAIPWQLGNGEENLYLRQAVVRIRSWQTLVPKLNGELRRKADMEGNTLALAEEAEGHFDELVVVQMRTSERGDKPWRVWGLASETKEEDWEDVEDPGGAYERREERRYSDLKENFNR